MLKREWNGSRRGPGAVGSLARKRGLYSDKLFAGAPEFLVTPLIIGPVCLIIAPGRFEEPVCPGIQLLIIFNLEMVF